MNERAPEQVMYQTVVTDVEGIMTRPAPARANFAEACADAEKAMEGAMILEAFVCTVSAAWSKTSKTKRMF